MKQSLIKLACQEKTADLYQQYKGINSVKSFYEAKLSIEQDFYIINKFIKHTRYKYFMTLEIIGVIEIGL